jgi:hypothetical protein
MAGSSPRPPRGGRLANVNCLKKLAFGLKAAGQDGVRIGSIAVRTDRLNAAGKTFETFGTSRRRSEGGDGPTAGFRLGKS